MGSLAREQTSDCSNPVLDIFFQAAGQLVDVAELSFQIFDISDAAKIATPVQVFPVVEGDKETVDVNTDCPAPGAGRLSIGRFVATYTVANSEPIGLHRIKWFIKLTSPSPEQTFQEEFEVLGAVSPSPSFGYALVSDLRAEGVTEQEATDARIQQMITLESRRIDRLTGQWFEPRLITMLLDGTGSVRLGFSVPIIAVNTVKIDGVDLLADNYKVYNRHLSGMLHPDDRDDPRLQGITGVVGQVVNDVFRLGGGRLWTRGEQNIEVAGLFGYTDPPGPQGSTPDLIRLVTKLLVLKQLPLMVDDDRLDRQLRRRVTMEKTRDQTIAYAQPRGGSSGYLTGDEEIDQILELFIGPLGIGSA